MKYKKKREMESKKNKKRMREVDEPLLVARLRLLVIKVIIFLLAILYQFSLA